MECPNGARDIRGNEVGSNPPRAGLASDALTERTARLALIVVLVLVFLAYLDTLWFQFVHDDQFQIVQNTWLRSWRYLPRYFTGAVWSFMHPTLPGNYYRPLFLLLFRLEYFAFGLRPWAWHLCTVLMQVGVAAMVYGLAVCLFKDRLAGIFAALIFGLHPIHAEAVAWVSGVTEPLLALPLISSFLCYRRRRTEHHCTRAYLAASLVLYALALLAKETALILPMIIFASELIWSEPAGASRLRAWRHRGLVALAVITPYLVLSGAYLGLRVTALHGFQNPPESHPVLDMILTWPSVLWFYIRHLIWPVGLGPFYDVGYVTHPDIRNVVLPALAVVLMATGLCVWARRSREVALASLWLVLPILPVLDLRVFPAGQLVHDRYLYLPSCGLALLVAWGLRRLQVGSVRLLGHPALQVGLAIVLGLALGVSATQEAEYFANNTTFFQRANAMSAKSDTIKSNLASLLGNQGRLGEATKLYEEVWQSKPDSWEVNYNLGYAYYLQGRLPDADRLLSRAVQIDPSRPESFFYLGLTRLKLGDANGAAADVQRAIAIRPDAEHYHFALGIIFRLQGNLPGALSEFQTELELDPDNAAARQQAAEIEAARGGGRPTAPSGSTPVPSSTPLR
jgi:tetratricopeptide (TPR) repeat protein